MLLKPAPFDDTQNPPAVGLREIPQPLTKFGSTSGATPASSEARSVAMYAVAAVGTERLSSPWTLSRDRLGQLRDGRANFVCTPERCRDILVLPRSMAVDCPGAPAAPADCPDQSWS